MHGNDDSNVSNDVNIDRKRCGNVSARLQPIIVGGDVLAVMIRGLYPEFACEAFIAAFEGGITDKFRGYAVEPQLARIERPLYEAAADGGLAAYFAEAHRTNWAIQRAMYPIMTSATVIWTVLDNAWPAGALLLRIDGRPCPFGISRKVDDGGETGIHSDMPNWDYAVEEFLSARTNLSFLVYPSQFEGGELELWPDTINQPAIFKGLMDKASGYALDRKRVGPPAVTIHPGKGDAVLFDARRLHAVREVRKGPRYSQSGFINVRGLHEPLSLYH
jgi:hypothetical protein